MTIEVKIIADSVAPNKKRITTFLLKYPRFFHQEVLTHRALSRNAASSRAIPFKRVLKSIQNDMATPICFTKNKPGMQGGELLSPLKQRLAMMVWKLTGHMVLLMSKLLNLTGAAKQFTNRMSEPWSHITVVMTATEWANFFALRYHPDAQPELYELAKKMYETYIKSEPELLNNASWHLPFITETEIYGESRLPVDTLIKISVARCARTSYNNFDGKPSKIEDDLRLYEKLVGAQPIHASAAEHQATPLSRAHMQSGNFFGWKQYRKTLDGENIEVFVGPINKGDL